MVRVRIRSNNSKDPNRKLQLLQLLSENEIYVNRIIVATEAFIIITNEESDLDRLFNGVTDRYLQNSGFTPVMPPELKAKRSIIIFNVDSHIYNNEVEEMISEIMDKNAYTNNQVTDLLKIPRTKMIKITFTRTSIAKKATETGLRMFSMSIPTHQIEQDTHVEVKSCMRCYKIEDHNTSECPKPQEFKICLECGEEGHIWRDCSSEIKKCINCKGEHRTLAMKCELRKEVIKQKRKERKEATTTYSNITKRNTNIQQTTHYTEVPTISPSTHTLSYDCFMYAHIVNVGNPGSFQVEVNNMRKMNNLPPIKTPDNPPSAAILNVMAKHTDMHITKGAEERESNTEQANIANAREEEEMDEIIETRSNIAQQLETTEILQETMSMQGKRRYMTRGEEIGLMIYTKQSEGFPKKEEFTRQVLVAGLQNRKYKYTYANENLTEEEVIKMIENKSIEVTAHCFARVDASTFGKIRSGLIEEKTPPPSKEQRRGRN